MSSICYRIRLSPDAVQPLTVPSGAQFLSAVIGPDNSIELHFLADDHADAMIMVVEQVVIKPNTDNVGPIEESIRYIGSVPGHWGSGTNTVHLFEVLS